MKGDFSRCTFDPHKHYVGVRMQQGRVQLDADWNEQADILLHLIRTQLADLLGPSATAAAEPGFAITLVEPAQVPADQAQAGQPEESTAPDGTLPDFRIGAGRFYVEGMLCENEAPVLFSRQPDYPDAESLLQKPVDDYHFLVYLDVWQRHITAVQDHAIREIALGGPDTTTRVKTVWQVKLLPLSGDPAGNQGWRDRGGLCSLAEWKDFVEEAGQKGLLKARWNQSKGTVLENRLYRVEIHSVADDQVTFKWSRENGSVVFPVENYQLEDEDVFTWEDVPGKDNERLLSYLREGLALDWVDGESVQIDKPDEASMIRIAKDRAWVEIMLDKETKTATLTTSDEKRRFLKVRQKEGKHELYKIIAVELNIEGLERDPSQLSENDWVELSDDVTALSGRSLPLCQVTDLDRPNARVALHAEQDKIDQILEEIDARELHHPLLRRWEAEAKPVFRPENTAGDQDQGWLELESGIQVAFSDTGTYRVGDYWLIPARTQSKDGIEWPQKDSQPLSQAPHGIAHHYAPLALLQFQEGDWSVLTEESTAFGGLPQISANLSATEGQLEAALSRLREVQQTVDTLGRRTLVFETVNSEESLEKGDVVSLDRASVERMGPNGPGAELAVKLASSKERLGPLVVGVVTEKIDEQRCRVALYGRVRCKVKGRVEPGDLLVPSPEPGHAQKRGWFLRREPIIGKALSSTAFDEGNQTGALDMLVTLGYRITGPKAPPKKRLAFGIGAVALILVLSAIGWFLFSKYIYNPYWKILKSVITIDKDLTGKVEGLDVQGDVKTQELTVTGKGAITLPSGSTAERPASPHNGALRYNNETKTVEVFFEGMWFVIMAGDVKVFEYTGADQEFTVPNGVTKIFVKAWGAGGAGGTGLEYWEMRQFKETKRKKDVPKDDMWNYGSYGGGGGFSRGVLTVKEGETLNIMVGEGGKVHQIKLGYGGGGPATANGERNWYCGGGGGRSAVVRQDGAQLIVAGGGGGGGSTKSDLFEGKGNSGGAGGGLTGENGDSQYDEKFECGGKGGSQESPGAGGKCSEKVDGQNIYGGDGVDSDGGKIMSKSYGGGGGGGWKGGGSGGYSEKNTMGGGGGGSGYIGNASYTITITGSGSSCPMKDDPDYLRGVGIGGQDAQDGGNGLVVIRW